jgi:WD40 repeat protein
MMQGQVLRVLDYSRLSRHILATAGDDGSVHLWDTTARSPKVPSNIIKEEEIRITCLYIPCKIIHKTQMKLLFLSILFLFIFYFLISDIMTSIVLLIILL